MVLPLKHVKMEDLDPEEVLGLHSMVAKLKTRLVELYPDRHPTILTYADTMHASIPEHYHIHLIPTDVKIRQLISNYNPSISEREAKEASELERMAKKIKGE